MGKKTIIRGIKYRVYPTPEQEEMLLKWENDLRWLWNCALEQRFSYFPYPCKTRSPGQEGSGKKGAIYPRARPLYFVREYSAYWDGNPWPTEEEKKEREKNEWRVYNWDGAGSVQRWIFRNHRSALTQLGCDPSKMKTTGSSLLYPYNSAGMSKQVTELRQDPDLPFRDMPRCPMLLVLDAVEKAFIAWYSPHVAQKRYQFQKQREAGLLPHKKAKRWLTAIGRPRFKRRMDPVSIIEGAGFKVEPGCIKVWTRRLGPMKAVIHRMPEGKLARCAIQREADRWFASVSHKVEIEEPEKVDVPRVGIDRGVKFLFADSSGRVVERPTSLAGLEKRIRFLRKGLSRKEYGSENWKKAKIKVDRAMGRKSRVVSDLLHKESLYYAQNYGVVVLEDLKVGAMSSSAKGSVEKPGSDVAQKAGLNRVILESGWQMFKTMLEYKMDERGGTVVTVPPHYTSQRCSVCGMVDPESRKSRDRFECVSCGHSEHADINAAKNILAIGMKG